MSGAMPVKPHSPKASAGGCQRVNVQTIAHVNDVAWGLISKLARSCENARIGLRKAAFL